MVGWVRLAVEGERGTRGPAALRRDARARRLALHRQPARRAPARHVRAARRRREVCEPRFTFHGFRYVEVTGLPTSRPGAITGRVVHSDTPRSGEFECSERAGQPALAQHRLGPARQLPLGPDRLPAARRAARLAGRRAGLPPHRDAEHGRRRVHHQVGRRRARRAVARGRLPRRRAAAGRSSATARPRGPTPGHRAVDRSTSATATVRLARAPLGRDGALHGLPRCATTPTCCGRRGAATTTATGSPSAPTRPRDVLATAYWAYDAAADGARWPRALGTADRAEHYERLRAGDRRRLQPRLRRRRRLHRGRHADRLPARAAHGPAAGRAAARAPPSASSRTSSATTGTSRPASSASGCCARC